MAATVVCNKVIDSNTSDTNKFATLNILL